MRIRRWFRPPHHLLTLFLAITLVLAAGLAWLGWQILEQDRALEGQRIQERLAQASELVSANLLPSLAGLDQRVSALAALPDPVLARQALPEAQGLGGDAVIVVFRPDNISAYPESRLTFYPALPAPTELPPRTFAAGEGFEFREDNYSKAAASYRQLTHSENALIRAGALLRLARVLRKMHEPGSALKVYQALAQLDPTPVGGLPAGLVARAARCEVLAELKRSAELEREARALSLDLDAGRWKLTRASFLFCLEEVSQWLSPSERKQADQRVAALALSAATDSLWDEWQRIRQGEAPASGRRSLWVYSQSVFLLWRGTPERMVALVAGPAYFKQRWRGLFETFEQQGLLVMLVDAEGHTVVGSGGSGNGPAVASPPGDTRLPWTLRVASANPARDMAQLASRRRLLLAGLGLVALVVLAGSYFTARAMTRELEVARVQSDFVSAVSHEFRTPLASLLQLSELLADGRVATDQRRQDYYQSLLRETERLSRLVEGLLDFGRMEAGGREYRFELMETAALVQSVAEEFGREAAERGYQIETQLEGKLPPVRGDREALSRALWNLLDNAVKYSPGCKTVRVEAGVENGRVAIRVRDRGLGIALEEQKQIFKKFVRARSARVAGVRGTGIGLAMVERIARAHGGRAAVESEPGRGSAFTILLPVAKE